MIFGTSGKDLR